MKITIPMSCDEITLSQWADYREAEDKFLESNSLEHLIESMKVLYGDELGDLEVGKADDELILGKIPTFMGLYRHTTQLINGFKPEILTMPFSYEYEGAMYFISAADTALVAGLHPITVNEAVTLLELTRHVGEGYGALYNLTISHLAVLLRKEGEQLPLMIADRERFIDQRKYLWKDAPMSLALNIQAYFNALIIGILSKFPSQDGKQTKESMAMWDKVGWNSLVTTLNMPIREALEQPLEDALYVSHYKTS